MDRLDYYFKQTVTEAELDLGFNNAEKADHAMITDQALIGRNSGFVVSEAAPTPNLTVDITGGVAYDQQGQRIFSIDTENLDVSVDSASVSTAVVGGGNSKIVSVFIEFQRNLSDPRIDGNSMAVFFSRAEDFDFFVTQGAESAGTPTPPPLDAGRILIADITLTFGQVQIFDADISFARRQDLIKIAAGTTAPGISEGTIEEGIAALHTIIDDFLSGVSLSVPAASVDYAGGPNWADGTTNPATDVEAHLDKIITDLNDTAGPDGGADKIGMRATATADFGTPAGPLGDAVEALVGELQSLFDSLQATAPPGSGFVGVDSTGFHALAVGDMSSTTLTGGLGTPTTAQDALDNADIRLVRQRYFAGLITDGTGPAGNDGDFSAASLNDVIDGTFLNGGHFLVKPGAYTVDSTVGVWLQRLTLEARGDAASPIASLELDASIVANLSLGSGAKFKGISLLTASTTGHFQTTGNFVWEPGDGNPVVDAGALRISSPGSLVQGMSVDAASVSTRPYGIEINVGGGVFEHCTFAISTAAVAAIASLYLTNSVIDRATTFRHCVFNNSNGDSSDSLRLNAALGPVTFEDCTFNLSTIPGNTGWAAQIIDSPNVRFVNCRFEGGHGQAVRVQNSGVVFEQCVFTSTGATGTVTDPQLIVGSGMVGAGNDSDRSLVFRDCIAFIGTSNVRATGAPLKPIIEFGGESAAAVAGRVFVENFLAVQTVAQVHNFSTIVVWGNADNSNSAQVRGLVMDTSDAVADDTGTLSGANTTARHWIEFANDTVAFRSIAENVRVINVADSNAGNFSQGIVSFDRWEARDVIVDGASGNPGTSFNLVPLVLLDVSIIRNLVLFPTETIRSSTTGAGTVHLLDSSIIDGGRMLIRNGEAMNPNGPTFFSSAQYCEIHRFNAYVGTGTDPAQRFIELQGLHSRVEHCRIFIDRSFTLAIVRLIGGGSEINENLLRFDRDVATDIIDNLGNASSVIGNQLLSIGTAAPTINQTGTNRVPDGTNVLLADVNSFLANANSAIPTLF